MRRRDQKTREIAEHYGQHPDLQFRLTKRLVVFSREGFGGASLEEIAEEAGFSTGAVYSAFGGKRELFFALLDRCLDEEKRELSEIFGREESLEARISALGRWKPGPLESAEQWRVLATEFWLYAVRDPRARELLAERDPPGGLPWVRSS